jgi:hypothetical protein
VVEADVEQSVAVRKPDADEGELLARPVSNRMIRVGMCRHDQPAVACEGGLHGGNEPRRAKLHRGDLVDDDEDSVFYGP